MGLIGRILIAILPAAIVLLAGCGDWRHHKGYKIVSDEAKRHKVTRLAEVIVGPDITQWGIFKDYLILYKVAANGDGPHSDKEGYVIIDTNDGQTTFAATQKEYETIAVQQLDIPMIETSLTPI